MRKKICTFLLVAILFFSGCNGAYETAELTERDIFLASLTREDFIYDVDYMLAALEENFPSFGIIYTRNGVDMAQLGQNIREYIANEDNEMDFYRFLDVLSFDYFGHAHPIGHLHPLRTAIMFEAVLGNLRTFAELDPNFRLFSNVFANPATMLIYPPLSQKDAAFLAEAFAGENNLTTEIIEDGRIGYVHIRTFATTIDDNDRAVMNRFFDDIAGFEHLIIDIRGNTGGFVPFFDELIAGPLIDRQLSDTLHHFVMDGGHNMEFLRATGTIVHHRGGGAAALDRTARIAEEFGLTLPTQPPRQTEAESNWNPTPHFLDEYAHHTDPFDYFFLDQRFVEPSEWRERSGFDGRVWMLTDGYNFSAAQMVAEFYKNTGFATLVGETTGGAVPAPWGSNFFALPNTGIVIRYDPTFVTNRYGRPLEYGTQPHYFNRPGMDALETAVAMIGEQ